MSEYIRDRRILVTGGAGFLGRRVCAQLEERGARELIVRRRQYGMNAIGLLPVNLFGPGDNFDPATGHVIPALIRKFIEARQRGYREVTCWGSGTASREFLYVDDCAEAVALALERYDGAEPVNVGAGRETTIRELAETIRRLCGFDGAIRWHRSQPDGQPRRCLDTSRAEAEFGFTAHVGVEEGLRRTFESYEKQIDATPLRERA